MCFHSTHVALQFLYRIAHIFLAVDFWKILTLSPTFWSPPLFCYLYCIITGNTLSITVLKQISTKMQNEWNWCMMIKDEYIKEGGVDLVAKIVVVYWPMEGMVHDRCRRWQRSTGCLSQQVNDKGNSLPDGTRWESERQAVFPGSIAMSRFL